MAFATAKVTLNTEIRASYESLCQSTNTSPRGDLYRVFMAKTRGMMAPTKQLPMMLKKIIEGIIPR